MKIIEMLARKGTNCRPGKALKPEYITIHNTANTSVGAGAEAHGRYLQGGGAVKFVSWHYAVDSTHVVRCIPDTETAWHAGDGSTGTGNTKSLAIEICENPESDLLIATNTAAELAAHLMRDYGIPITKVVQHNRWSGKDCPRRIRKGEPYDWGTFLARVQAEYTALTMPADPCEGDTLWAVQTGAFKVRGNATAYQAALTAKGISCFVTKSGDYWRVQTGAFAVEANAKAYAAQLVGKGIQAIVVRREV